MHPDVLDPELGALVHRGLGAFGPRSDHDSVDTAGDRAQALVGTVALDLGGVWVDREDLVPAVAEALVDRVTPVAILAVPRDARDRDPLVAEELGRRFIDALHSYTSTWSMALTSALRPWKNA